MSGRSGYRKTERKVLNRATPAELADYRLLFFLPTMIAMGLKPGPVPGIIGVKIKDRGQVEVIGKSRPWVIEQAGKFLDVYGKGHEFTVQATLSRGDEPSPTLSGPIRRGFRVCHEFVVVRGPAVIVANPLEAPLILKASA